MESKKTLPARILFFDGYCHLCSGFVDFVIQNEAVSKRWVFAALQGETAQNFLSQEDREALTSVLVLADGELLKSSKAVAFILLSLRRPWCWLGRLGTWMPTRLNETLYGWVAKNRLVWFGQRQTCRLPTNEEKAYLWP